MSTADKMSPDASPRKGSNKTGVRRVNNIPVYIFVSLIGLFLLIIFLVATERAAKQNTPATAQEEKVGNTTLFANAISAGQHNGIIAAAKLDSDIPTNFILPNIGAPVTPSTSVAIEPPENLHVTPTLFGGREEHQKNNDEMDRIRMIKLQQLEEAIKAKTAVTAVALRGTASGRSDNNDIPATPDDPTAAYKARLQQLRAAGLLGEADSTLPNSLQKTPDEKGKGYTQFDKSGQDDRWRLAAQLQAPRSPYTLLAGFVVPATLISGIHSDLPGQIIAQVSQDVFDTATGKHRLIPQGSRLVGRYANEVGYGQSRLLIAWQRIIFPDGKTMDIGAMPGADSAGYAGLNDKVNNHYFRLFSSALLMSGVTAGVAISQNDSTTLKDLLRPTASSAMSQALGLQLGQVTAQLIAKNLNISPTLEIRPGYRFNIIVTKDINFAKPYKAFDY